MTALLLLTNTWYLIIFHLRNWQELVGAIIGGSAAFFVWWFSQKYLEHKEYKNRLYALNRDLLDRINNVADADRTIRIFLDVRLAEVLRRIDAGTDTAYSTEHTFFPLFSMRPLDTDINKFSTKSVYLDTKISHAHNLSEDIPIIIEDVRRQFESTILMNREMAFNKLGSPSQIRESYKINLEEFAKVIRNDLLGKNFPIYLKALTRAHIALSELSKKGYTRWTINFAIKYRFFLTRKKYIEALTNFTERMDKYFATRCREFLEPLGVELDRNYENLETPATEFPA